MSPTPEGSVARPPSTQAPSLLARLRMRQIVLLLAIEFIVALAMSTRQERRAQMKEAQAG